MIYLFNHYTIRSLLHPLNYSKLKKVVFWEHFLRFSTIFLLKTSMWNITLYALNTLFTIKIISSNKSYWMYCSLWSLTVMVPLPIFSDQGGTVFTIHPVYIENQTIGWIWRKCSHKDVFSPQNVLTLSMYILHKCMKKT